MRTNIDLNDDLIREFISLTALKSKKEVVDTALKSFLAQLKRKQMLKFRGNLNWDGDLDELRSV